MGNAVEAIIIHLKQFETKTMKTTQCIICTDVKLLKETRNSFRK